MGAFYVFFFIVFSYIYGGMSYGYLKGKNIIFSQILALLCTNTAIYLETVLLSAKFVTIVPMVQITGIGVLVVVVLSTFFDVLFKKMFPPHRMLVLYQEYDPSIFLNKVKKRRDRYRIVGSFKVDVAWEKLTEIIDQHEAILIYDVHSELRNRILKYCYEKEIRVYMTPKISDILIRSSDNIHLFDTPLLLSRNNGLTFEQRLM